jgi:phosphate transport system substrate-binding protein
VKQLPVALGATVIVYSEKLPTGLRFNGLVLAKIYMGEIKTWNDKDIAAINPGKELPNWQITPVHRSDGSASTAIFTNYLSQNSPEWKEAVGTAPAVQWKEGAAAKGSEGIAGVVRSTDGAIGYLEFAFAEANHLRPAAVQNSSENFILPSTDSISVAANIDPTSDLRTTLRAPRSPEAYPMASASWILIPLDTENPRRSLILLDYVNSSFLDDNKSKVQTLGYIPLPPSLEASTRRQLNDVAAAILRQAHAVPDGR